MAIWHRIDNELRRRRKNWQWLADQLEWSIQRLQNWKTRGVPANAHAPVAQALNRSNDWLLGLEEPIGQSLHVAENRAPYLNREWPFTRVSLQQVMALPVEEFERVHGYLEATVLAWESNAAERKSRPR